MQIKKLAYNLFHHNPKPMDPEKAYDLWAKEYDSEEDNLVFFFENEILNNLLEKINLNGTMILDYGCGTGRNWERLFLHNPKEIIGCDVSKVMLEQLKKKFPDAQTYYLEKDKLPPISSQSVDVIFSTLVIAQIENLKEIFSHWDKLLKPNGKIIITDLHPKILAAGGKRTFKANGKEYEIKNYEHSLEEIEKICSTLELKILETQERYINENVIDFYKRKNALHIFQRFKGLPLVYGMLIEKALQVRE